MEFSFQYLVQVLLYPVYIVFILIPTYFDNWYFNHFKSSIRQLRKNCIFLINPSSGKKLGNRVFEILEQLKLKERCVDITENDYLTFIEKHHKALTDKENLYVVICGGDGTVSTIISDIEKRVPSMEHIVFVPMPIGTGNDLSQALNFGRSFGIRSFFKYFEKLNSDNTSIVKFDSWDVEFTPSNLKQESWKRKMLLYLNFGYDARVTEVYDKARKKWPFMFQLNFVV